MDLYIAAYTQRLSDAQRLLAWHLAPLLNIQSSKDSVKFTPAMLMGEGRSVDLMNDPHAHDKLGVDPFVSPVGVIDE